MENQSYITISLILIIGFVILIDFFIKSRKNSLEKSIEKYNKKENTENKFSIGINSFFWVYPILFIINIPLFVALYIEYQITEFYPPISFYDFLKEVYSLPIHISIFAHFIFSVPVLLYYLNLKYSFGSRIINWIVKRKKNIAMSLFLIVLFKTLIQYFFYSISDVHYSVRWISRDGVIRIDNIFLAETWLYIPVIIVFLLIVWYFNDKIKAK